MQQDDEIDLYELFEELYRGKWLIISTILVALACGGSYAIYKERNQVFSYQSTISHQSTIAFTAKNLPPFYNTNYVFSDLRELFHSPPAFEAWKASNSEAPIDFGDISLTQVVDGVELASNSSLVSLDASGLTVNANDLQVLDGFHSYLSSLNETLTRQYIVRAGEEINYIERRFKDFWASDAALRDQVLILLQHTNELRNLARYVERAESGAHIFEITRPTLPVVTSTAPAPKTNLIVALSIVLGGFVGAAYVLLRNAIRRRRETSKSG